MNGLSHLFPNVITNNVVRFFVHRSIRAFLHDIITRHGRPGQQSMLFPNARVARRCVDFIRQRASPEVANQVETIDFALDTTKDVSPMLKKLSPTVSVVVYPAEAFPLAKQYWQHTGDGASSRRAEFCHSLFKDDLLIPVSKPQTPPEAVSRPFRGPKRYTRPGSISLEASTPVSPAPTPFKTPEVADPETPEESLESSLFLEERFGRNLDLSMVERAKSAIRRRIAGAMASEVEVDLQNGPLPDMTSNTRGVQGLQEDDVYLYPAGMNAIYNAHRALLRSREPLKSISFGFPYVDTLKILEKFGPGCLFYGNGSSTDLDDIEARFEKGERYMALFCEFPGNPLLSCPNLKRIRQLADKYDFAVVVDETIGTFANINVLQYSDIVVSSLTKIFSGDSNVMGGSAILNPESQYYKSLKQAFKEDFEDTYWPEDIIFMERNCRDFQSRVVRINTNAEAICDVLRAHPLVKKLFYPKYNTTRACYDSCRLPNGGYGGLLSVVFNQKAQAEAFYDTIQVAKGPSLGTNFTLCSPYVLLAHYGELEWASEFGVDPDLVRVSVGLEETSELQDIFQQALKAAEEVKTLETNGHEATVKLSHVNLAQEAI